MAADLRRQIADNNSKGGSAQLYDFGFFTLKPSSISAFKLWWETSLGCEHLIQEAARKHTQVCARTHARAHTFHFIRGLWEAEASGA